jgi:membrane-bound lytic murein transglycosylase A
LNVIQTVQIQIGYCLVWQQLKPFNFVWIVLGALLLVSCQPSTDDIEIIDTEIHDDEDVTLPTSLELIPAHWDALAGWGQGDLLRSLSSFVRSCERMANRPDELFLNPQAEWVGRYRDWREPCATALSAPMNEDAALAVFEAVFTPVRVVGIAEDTGQVSQSGMLTGYYEPYVEVRRETIGEFTQGLRRRPDDLISVDLGLFDPSLSGRHVVGQAVNGRLVHYRDRENIELTDAGEVFAYGRPIDVFFLQIQGSGRLVFEGGYQERAAFAAHNGLPYSSIGRELIQRGELELHAASKAGIENWLNENGAVATAELFAVNPRYVFFASETLDDPELGPRGSSGVSLTPMASLAVDPAYHAHGVPVWLNVDLPDAENWSGLVISQDSGGAITGPLRGDFFWGWGDEAERRAGTTRGDAVWTLLLPKAVVDRIVDVTPPA